MKRLKELLLSTDLTMGIFCLIGLRVTVFGASIGDALVIGSICALHGFNAWNVNNLELKKQAPLNERIDAELQEIRSAMSGLQMKSAMRPTVTASGEPKVPQRFF
jgi:hypothetical protein